VDRWPLPQKATVPATLATTYAVTTVGTGLTKGFAWSQGVLDRTGAFDRSFLLLVVPQRHRLGPWQGSNPHHALARQSPSRRSLAWRAVTRPPSLDTSNAAASVLKLVRVNTSGAFDIPHA
jgi:hypothetical protein